MITLKEIDNDYYLNGKKGDYWNFNFDGKYKQIDYTIIVKDGKVIKKWTFEGNI